MLRQAKELWRVRRGHDLATARRRLKSLLETRWYFLWQGAIFFQAGVDSSVLDCFKKVKQVRQTE